MFRATMLDVGQGEAIVLDFPSGDFALIDGGPVQTAQQVIAAIRARVVADKGQFLFVAATQFDSDHVGALPAVLRLFPPAEFVHAAIDVALLEEIAAQHEGTSARRAVGAIQTVLDALKIDRRPMFAKQAYPLPNDKGVELSVLSPYTAVRGEVHDWVRRGATKREWKRLGNRASLAMWCRVNGRAIFLPAEVEDDQYEDLLSIFNRRDARGSDADDPRASWVKLSHHGSKSNNPIAMFQKFCATSFVGSASAGGRFGHPHPTVLKRLRFECGGTAMCTRLGQGCHAILGDSSLAPDEPDGWASRIQVSKRPNPNLGCFGDISVTVDPAGDIAVTGGDIRQLHCPYGGPPTGVAALPKLKRARRGRGESRTHEDG